MSDISGALAALQPFSAFNGHLTGEPVQPFMSSPEGERYQRGSVVRVFAGALPGTAGVIGGGELPDIGELDIAPAMAMAAFEADYWVRSYDTLIAWHLGYGVYGIPPEGEWIQVAERCNREYGRFGRTTTRHQNIIAAAIGEIARTAEALRGI